MAATLYRTGETSLTDDELLILDVIFSAGTTPRLLRRRYFKEQWNAEPHKLDDQALAETLRGWLKSGIISQTTYEHHGEKAIALTSHGGELWSAERCPVWERYCTDRYKTTLRGRTLMSVSAVSAAVRDDFLELWPEYPPRRRTARIRDFGLIAWHPFGTLHVGVATYMEQNEWSCSELSSYDEQYREYSKRLETNRTWWRTVDELQRFVGDDTGS